MTKPRTLEEIAEHAADNFEGGSQLRLSESDREVFILNVVPALREAADARDAEWREASLRIRKISTSLAAAGIAGHVTILEILAGLDARSREREALRPAAPEPTPSEPLANSSEAGPQYDLRGSVGVPTAGSEQPDLPLGHPFVFLRGPVLAVVCAICGQPESAHRRKS